MTELTDRLNFTHVTVQLVLSSLWCQIVHALFLLKTRLKYEDPFVANLQSVYYLSFDLYRNQQNTLFRLVDQKFEHSFGQTFYTDSKTFPLLRWRQPYSRVSIFSMLYLILRLKIRFRRICFVNITHPIIMKV